MGAYKDEKRGSWYAAFYYKDWTGQRKHKVKRGFKTQREAKAWEREFLQGEAHEADIPFGALIDLYYKDAELRLKPTTIYATKSLVNKWIRPYLKDLPISDITVATVRSWQNHILNYRDDKGNPLAPSFMHSISIQLSTIMNFAVKNYGLVSNPCTIAGAIGKQKPREMDFWTHEEYNKFRSCENHEHYRVAFDVLFYCGLRCGELLALMPEDFSDDLMLRINKNYAQFNGQHLILTPKTESSERTISIPEFLYQEVMEFCRHRSCEKGQRIFSLSKTRLTYEMKRKAAQAGLKEIRIHDLRHSHVALLIDQGFSMKEIQERMGHRSITTTMDTYGHLYKDRKNVIGDRLQTLRQDLDSKPKEKGNEQVSGEH